METFKQSQWATYDGMSGAGRAWPGAGRPPGTGGALPVDELESDWV